MGCIKNALSHLTGVDSKYEFARGVALGFGSNMEPLAREDFVDEMQRLMGEKDLLYVSAGSVDRDSAPAAGIVQGTW